MEELESLIRSAQVGEVGAYERIITRSGVSRNSGIGEDAVKALHPEIVEMPAIRVATVTSRGDPNVVGEQVFPALYGSVFTLKFELKRQGLESFKVRGLRARWPDAHILPKGQWTGHWALPIPENVTELPQKSPEAEVRVETWEYGTVAQILHLGPYSEEGPTVALLHKFIEENGYEIAGPHEEEYLTKPTSKVIKTIIRYRVVKAAGQA